MSQSQRKLDCDESLVSHCHFGFVIVVVIGCARSITVSESCGLLLRSSFPHESQWRCSALSIRSSGMFVKAASGQRRARAAAFRRNGRFPEG